MLITRVYFHKSKARMQTTIFLEIQQEAMDIHQHNNQIFKEICQKFGVGIVQSPPPDIWNEHFVEALDCFSLEDQEKERKKHEDLKARLRKLYSNPIASLIE